MRVVRSSSVLCMSFSESVFLLRREYREVMTITITQKRLISTVQNEIY
ncbi:hypothetical protein AXX16_3106 [Serratia rubidaea]|nr:hypothetical protein AXX16_3106 [Serratia rubidaea]